MAFHKLKETEYHNQYKDSPCWIQHQRLDIIARLEFAREIAKKVGDTIIMPHYKSNAAIEIKDNGTPVTIADKEADLELAEWIQFNYTRDCIVSEEGTNVEIYPEYTWYIDPIDGTKGFIRENDQFAIHIGIARMTMPVAGVIYRPTTQEMWFGGPGLGAFRQSYERKPIELKIDHTIDRDLIVGISPNLTEKEDKNSLLQKLDYGGIDRFGSFGLRHMRMLEGHSDVHFTTYAHLGTWDLCAPHAIFAAAGGHIARADGQSIRYERQREIGSPVYSARTRAGLHYLQERLG